MTASLVPFAGGDAWTAAVLGGGMLCYQFCIGVVNDIVDAPGDADAKPWKPIPAGALSLRTATRLALLFGAAGLLLTLALPLTAWLVSALGLACGLTYDLGLKRTRLSWLPLSLALPLVPSWVFLAAGEWDPLLWWLYPIGAVFGFALHLANQAPDIQPGNEGEAGIAGALGQRRSYAFAVTLFGLGASAAVLVMATENTERAVYAAAVAGAVAITSMRARAFFGVNGLFGVLAVGTAALAVFYLSAV